VCCGVRVVLGAAARHVLMTNPGFEYVRACCARLCVCMRMRVRFGSLHSRLHAQVAMRTLTAAVKKAEKLNLLDVTAEYVECVGMLSNVCVDRPCLRV